jgi:sigma-E factor negative regulatory protein RseA
MNADRQPDARERLTRGELLSSLADGEAPASAADEACRQWPTDDAMRSDWHVYHLIGDVLRSDELVGTPARDADFLQALRGKLAVEPIPLAPRPLPVAVPRVRRWLAPAAVAAGFAVVGAGVVALRSGSTGATGWDARIAVTQPPGSDTLRRVGGGAAPSAAQALVIDGQVIRDARLDAYFEAHRGALGVVPSAVPGGALRSVEILVPQR